MEYSGSVMVYNYGDALSHHGIKGQKWGVRRYQNEDGSLTNAGKTRYGVEDSDKKSTTKTNNKPGLFERYQRYKSAKLANARNELQYKREKLEYGYRKADLDEKRSALESKERAEKLAYETKKSNLENKNRTNSESLRSVRLANARDRLDYKREKLEYNYQKNKTKTKAGIVKPIAKLAKVAAVLGTIKIGAKILSGGIDDDVSSGFKKGSKFVSSFFGEKGTKWFRRAFR